MCQFTVVNYACGHWTGLDGNVLSRFAHLLDPDVLPFRRCPDGTTSILLAGDSYLCPGTKYTDIHSEFLCPDVCRAEQLRKKRSQAKNKRRAEKRKRMEPGSSKVPPAPISIDGDWDHIIQNMRVGAIEGKGKAPVEMKKILNDTPIVGIEAGEGQSKTQKKTQHREHAKTTYDEPLIVCGTVAPWKGKEHLWEPGAAAPVDSTNMDNDLRHDSVLTTHTRHSTPSFVEAALLFDRPAQSWLGLQERHFDEMMKPMVVKPRLMNVADVFYDVESRSYQAVWNGKVRDL